MILAIPCTCIRVAEKNCWTYSALRWPVIRQCALLSACHLSTEQLLQDLEIIYDRCGGIASGDRQTGGSARRTCCRAKTGLWRAPATFQARYRVGLRCLIGIIFCCQ